MWFQHVSNVFYNLFLAMSLMFLRLFCLGPKKSGSRAPTDSVNPHGPAEVLEYVASLNRRSALKSTEGPGRSRKIQCISSVVGYDSYDGYLQESLVIVFLFWSEHSHDSS